MNDNRPRKLAATERRIARRSSRGFNIVELMVGLTIVSILVGLSAPSFREYTRETRATAAQNDLITGELSYLDSLLDYAVARVALERAVGRPLEEGPAQ